MTCDSNYLFLEILVALIVFGATCGWFAGKSTKHSEDKFNKKLRLELDQREKYLTSLRQQFESGFLQGRKWLSAFVADGDRVVDEAQVKYLAQKSHPAKRASQSVSEALAERRKYKEQAIFLQYQLMSLKEYFPFLEEYEEIILDEAVPLENGDDNIFALEESDPVLKYVNRQEYDSLTETERNQRALDRYLSHTMSSAGIGRLYELYIGHRYERDGWQVEYHGIVKGYEDLGRDLICKRDNDIHIVQAKCWANEKTIHEKHIFQLFGTKCLYTIDAMQDSLIQPNVTASFETTTTLSQTAMKAANFLKIDVKRIPLSKDFPMIRCNINQQTKLKIYHLPFDQQYNRTQIRVELGECCVKTVAEAESLGFRRAYRHRGTFA
jgi:hypothetical protein